MKPIFLGSALADPIAKPKIEVINIISLIILTSPAKNNCLFNIFIKDHSTLLHTNIKKKVDIYLPLKKGIVSDAGALNFILRRLLEIIIKTIMVAKYGAILKN